MDTARFDDLLRSLALATSRRGVLAALSGGLFVALPLAFGGDGAAARKRRKRKRKRKKRKNKKNTPDKPVTRADAACGGPELLIFSFVGQQRVAQTFTAQASGSLVTTELALRKDPGSTGDFILQLETVTPFGVPTDEVLAVTSVGNASVPEGDSTVAFSFGKPFSVEAGVQYALVLVRPGGNVTWLGHLDDTCPGRAFQSSGQTGPFEEPPAAGLDLVFTTFVQS